MKNYLSFLVILVGLVVAGYVLWSNGKVPASREHGQASASLQGSANPVLLDVRTDDEWNAGYAEGALHFDLALLQKGELPDISKDKEIWVYCRTGKRAEIAKGILQEPGFVNVKNAGGLTDLKVNIVQ